MQIQDIVLTYHLLSMRGVGRTTVNGILSRLAARDLSVRDLIHPDIWDEFAIGSPSEDDRLYLAEPPARLVEQIQAALEGGIRFLLITDPDYPRKLIDALGDGSPPILSLKGAFDLLELPSIGFCGSRKASPKGLETALDCASQVAEAGIVTISGNASGIDLAAHFGALEYDGSTIMVLPEGILRFRVRTQLRDCWDWDRVLVLSEFEPGVLWLAHHAMERNKTIIGLSDAMIVIEAGPKGGTIEAGKTTLEMGRSLFAPVYYDMPETAAGNQYLLSRGAMPIKKSRQTGRANLKPLLKVVNDGIASQTPRNNQFRLGLG